MTAVGWCILTAMQWSSCNPADWKRVILGVAVCALGLLTGCASAPPAATHTEVVALDLTTALFGPKPEIISVERVHALSSAQEQAFLDFLEKPKHRDIPRHKLIRDYLKLETQGFGYVAETRTAQSTLATSAGNCLSLAIVTTALAELAEVDISYQLIDSNPIFESDGNLIRRSLHVRSVLYDPTWESRDGFWVMSRPRIAIDYFPGDYDRYVGSIGASDYHAMYYQNLAADALEAKDLSRAYWLLMETLTFSPNNAESLNMLAIVFDRAGDKAKSEQIYRHGIATVDRRVSLLRNYGGFLAREGRHTEAELIRTELESLEDPNPFDWIFAGQQALTDGEYWNAIRFFEKSAALAPYLHESYFGLARSYIQLGDLTQAQRALHQAVENADQASTRDLYVAKLAELGE